MKKLTLVGLVGITSIALTHAGWAAGRGGGGGGFHGGGFGGGHFGGGGGLRGAGAGLARPGFSGSRPGYYYSRGMGFANSGGAQLHSPVRRSPSFVGSNGGVTNHGVTNHGVTNSGVTNRGVTNRGVTNSGVTNRGATNSGAQPSQKSGRPALNGRTDHIAERHGANNWHGDWDRRHAHYDHNRFFVFDNGFWFGLDDGFFPWDYYPYYAYDYYPYDYYPGYYADVEPYYYSEGVYSNTPVSDPTVTAVQTQLAQQGYYGGPIDGIFGQLTRDAVAKYQIAKQLDVTGSLSPQTLQSFGLSQPAATQPAAS